MAQDMDRMEGVDLGDVESVFEQLEYPVTADEIVEQYGDREMDRTNAEPISIGELFSYMGGDTEFHSQKDLQEMLMSQMPEDSEGRTNYSDRGGSHPVETEEAEEAGEQTSADLEGEGRATDRDESQDGAL